MNEPVVNKPRINDQFNVKIVEVKDSYYIVEFTKDNHKYRGCILKSDIKNRKLSIMNNLDAIIIRSQYSVELFGKIIDYFDLAEV